MRKLGVLILLMLVLGVSAGCMGSSSLLQTKWTRQKLENLEVGMEKLQVLDVMGRPYTREVFTDEDGEPVEVLYYHTVFTGHALLIEPDEKHLTPIVLQDGKVRGWGRNFYDKTKRYHLQHDISIKNEP